MKSENEKNLCRENARSQAVFFYEEWKDEHEDFTYQQLVDKISSEIVGLLNSGIMEPAPSPTGREVKDRSVVIDDDSLEVDTLFNYDMDVACAKLSYFVSWTGPKNELLTLRYDRWDKFVQKHLKAISEEAFSAFYYFEAILELIHEDMAVIKPQLAPYLKNYEEHQLDRTRKECIEIINVCQPLLKSGIRECFLGDVIWKLLEDKSIREESQSKLCSIKTRNKYLCEIVAALDCNCIFRSDVSRKNLAKVLSEKMESVSPSSAEYYIKQYQTSKSGSLYDWMRKNVADLKAKPYNPFEGLVGGMIK
jgi:hypothetical protein